MTSLEALWLENNELSGEIPSSFGNLTKLTNVEVKDNRLTGCLPPAWAVVLHHDFDEAGLGFCHEPTPPTCSSGIIVPNPGDNPALVRDCEILLELLESLTEERPRNWDPYIPISNWTGVTLDGTPNRVHRLELGPRVTGTVPVSIGGLTALQVLDFHGSRFTGEIPYSLGDLADLSNLNLRDNQFTGEMPSSLGRLTQLSRLDLNGNQLAGEIPRSLGKLINLLGLDLSDNRLTGEIPPTVKGGVIPFDDRET